MYQQAGPSLGRSVYQYDTLGTWRSLTEMDGFVNLITIYDCKCATNWDHFSANAVQSPNIDHALWLCRGGLRMKKGRSAHYGVYTRFHILATYLWYPFLWPDQISTRMGRAACVPWVPGKWHWGIPYNGQDKFLIMTPGPDGLTT